MNKKQYELALAQFTGYSHGKGQALIDMVRSMGLKNNEWAKMKQNQDTYYLTYTEIAEIDEYFNNL